MTTIPPTADSRLTYSASCSNTDPTTVNISLFLCQISVCLPAVQNRMQTTRTIGLCTLSSTITA